MELKEFVSKTLLQIIEGVREAQASVDKLDGMVNPYIDPTSMQKQHTLGLTGHIGERKAVLPVEFDVVLSISEDSNVKSGAGIFVGAIGLGVQGQSVDSNSSQSRVKFLIPIVLPKHQT